MLYLDGKLKSPSKSQIRESISLMTMCMRENDCDPEKSYSIDKEYPNVFTPENYDNIWCIYEKDMLISTLAAYPLKVNIKNIIYNAVGIGSVSTHPRYRKQGLSGKLHSLALDYYEKIKEYDFAILWTDMFDYYRKFGYELVGHEVIFTFNEPVDVSEDEIKIESFSKNKIIDIYDLYNDHKNCIKRTIEEFQLYLNIPDMEILTASKNNRVIAYTIRGKGHDLTSTIHEWGGNINALKLLINKNIQNETDPVSLISAPNEKLLQELHKMGLKPFWGHLGMIKILNTESLEQKLNIDNLTIKKINKNFLINFEGVIKKIHSRELSKLIFGPQKPHEILGIKFKELSHHLPLPFFVWGLDSV